MTDEDGNATNYLCDKFNNMSDTKVGVYTLATYTYGEQNGPLKKLTYGNGDYIDYVYDLYGNVKEIKHNGEYSSLQKIESETRIILRKR